MKKISIVAALLLSLSAYKANAGISVTFTDTTVAQKIAALEQKVNKQEQEIKQLKENRNTANSKGTPVVTRKKFIVTRTGSKQVVAVD